MTMMDVSTLVVGLSLVASIAVQAVYSDIAFGMRYSASARDEERSDVMSRRLARVVRNQVEGAAMFAPLAILAGLGKSRLRPVAFAAWRVPRLGHGGPA